MKVWATKIFSTNNRDLANLLFPKNLFPLWIFVRSVFICYIMIFQCPLCCILSTIRSNFVGQKSTCTMGCNVYLKENTICFYHSFYINFFSEGSPDGWIKIYKHTRCYLLSFLSRTIDAHNGEYFKYLINVENGFCC